MQSKTVQGAARTEAWWLSPPNLKEFIGITDHSLGLKLGLCDMQAKSLPVFPSEKLNSNMLYL